MFRARILHRVRTSCRYVNSSFSSQSVRYLCNSLRADDVLLSGMNTDQDVVVRVVSATKLLQETIVNTELGAEAAKAFAELTLGSLMMGVAGLKEEETLQISIVGTKGLKNMMCITDSDCNIRGTVANPTFAIDADGSTTHANPGMEDLFGEGSQIQIVRNHPAFKRPVTGMVPLANASISLNLAMYMTQSEQRNAVILTDIAMDGSVCKNAVGIMVENLPSAKEENIDTAIINLENIQKRGLATYFNIDKVEQSMSEAPVEQLPIFISSLEPAMEKILDDVFEGMANESGVGLRWSKKPNYKCNCSMDKIWRTLNLLPVSDIENIVDNNDGKPVEIKCEFCGNNYNIDLDTISDKILKPINRIE